MVHSNIQSASQEARTTHPNSKVAEHVEQGRDGGSGARGERFFCTVEHVDQWTLGRQSIYHHELGCQAVPPQMQPTFYAWSHRIHARDTKPLIPSFSLHRMWVENASGADPQIRLRSPDNGSIGARVPNLCPCLESVIEQKKESNQYKGNSLEWQKKDSIVQIVYF